MKSSRKTADKTKINDTISSRIKNPDLVRKKHILIAKKSAKLFIKKGFAQTTMREISKATGMAIGNLYDYITKKEDILSLVFEAYHRHVQETMIIQDNAADENPLDQFRLFIQRSINNVKIFHDEIHLMYRESWLLSKTNLERAKQLELVQIMKLAKIIQKGIDQRVFRTQDPFFSASMIFFQLIILTMRGWTFRGKYSDNELEKLLEAYIVQGITPGTHIPTR